ncbi:MAG: hypothetical protein ABIN89_29545 [Chitinophagaceae bacterium]
MAQTTNSTISMGIIKRIHAFKLTFTNASDGSNTPVGERKNMIFIPYR